MNQGVLRHLMFWRNQKISNELGIYIADDNIWVYCPATIDADAIELVFPYHNKDWAQVFLSISSRFGAAKLNIVLCNSWYNILVADKPQVEANEIPQALVWAVKDMVSIPVQDLQLDYYESPIPNRKKISVICVEKKPLSSLVTAIYDANFQINTISIEQMALCCLDDTSEQAQLILSHYKEQDLLLTVIKNHCLYMQRRVRGFRDIDVISGDDLALGIADKLALELQRSMDYFESQMRQPPVNGIHLLIDGASEKLASLLNDNFSQSVEAISKTSVGAKFAELAYLGFGEDL